MNHTPGPWRWQDDGADFGRSITVVPWGNPDENIDPETGILPLVCLVSRSGYHIDGHANARLIAAAPDLLAAARAAWRYLSSLPKLSYQEVDTELDATLDVVLDALCKAVAADAQVEPEHSA